MKTLKESEFVTVINVLMLLFILHIAIPAALITTAYYVITKLFLS